MTNASKVTFGALGRWRAERAASAEGARSAAQPRGDKLDKRTPAQALLDEKKPSRMVWEV